jgi:hypothetical protein
MSGQQTLHFSCAAVLPVLIGAAIYVLWRSETLLVFRWIDLVGASDGVRDLRQIAGMFHPNQLVRDCLPNGLWVFAFTAALRFVWGRQHTSKGVWAWICLPVAMALGGEFGQLVKFVPGTFDWIDVLATTAGFILAVCLVSVDNERAFGYVH